MLPADKRWKIILKRGEPLNSLSHFQLYALLLCARCFSMMTFFPHSGETTLVFMMAVFGSVLLQALLLVPAAVMGAVLGKGLCHAAFEKSKPLGRFVTLLFLCFFLWDIFATSGNLAYFLDRFFSSRISRIFALVCALAVAVYIGCHSSAVLGKCAGIAFALFAVFMVVLMVSTFYQPDITNFHLAVPGLQSSFWNSLKAEFIRSRELAMLVFLMGDVKASRPKAAFAYLALKLIVLEFALGFVTLILGDFALSTDMPIYYLSCLSNSSVIERYDAGFMAVWTCLAVLRLAGLFHCCTRCLNLLWERIPRKLSVAIVILPAAATFGLLSLRRWGSVAYTNESFVPIAVLVGLMPLAALIVRKRREAKP